MAKVKLNLQNLSVPVKVQYARQVVTAMTGNANYTTPSPALANITTAANNLENAHNAAKAAADVAQTKHRLMNEAEDAYDRLLTQLGNYVENTSNGDGAKIKSAGMEVRSDASPVGDLPQAANLSATAGDKDGEIDLQWDKVKSSRSYIIEQSPDPITATSWKQAAVSTKSSHTVSGLMSGTKYWFHVAAVGAAGQGPWSDPAVKVAP